MNTPLVTVIVPCYNYGHFIAETLRSLQAQSLQFWECIVVDDGSKDNSAAVVRAFTLSDSRIKYVYQENQGLPSARNTGIEQAQGKYLQFLDSDDLLQVDKLRLQAEYLDTHPDTHLVYSGLRFFYDGSPELIYSAQNKQTPWALDKSGEGLQLLPFLVISCVIMPPMPLLRREVILQAIGLFTKDLRSCEDWEFWIRCAWKNCRFAYIDLPETLSLMRLHNTSMTRNRLVMVPSIIEVRQRLRAHLVDKRVARLNEKLLNNDYIEQSIVTQQHTGHFKGVRQAFSLSWQRKSLLLFFWALFIIICPHNLALKILSLQRSLQKRWYYRRFALK